MTAITVTNCFSDDAPHFKKCACYVPDNMIFFFVLKSSLLDIMHFYEKKMTSLQYLLFHCKLNIA